MKLKTLVAAVALSSVSQLGLAAENRDTERSAAAGMVVGGLVGGPAGAFAGAVFGGEVIGRWFSTHRENRTLAIELTEVRAVLDDERRQNDALVSALNQDLDKLLAIQRDASQHINLPIQFRTSSSDVEPQYQADLDRIAGVLKRNRDARVTLEGFADRRGDIAFNQQLSEKRVESIRSYLQQKGADRHQILTLAYGESRPVSSEETLESNFFDRRVVVELNMNTDPQLATR